MASDFGELCWIGVFHQRPHRLQRRGYELVSIRGELAYEHYGSNGARVLMGMIIWYREYQNVPR